MQQVMHTDIIRATVKIPVDRLKNPAIKGAVTHEAGDDDPVAGHGGELFYRSRQIFNHQTTGGGGHVMPFDSGRLPVVLPGEEAGFYVGYPLIDT